MIAFIALIALWAFSYNQNWLDRHAKHLRGDKHEDN